MEIRVATPADIGALAALRFRWSPPAMTETVASQAGFARELTEWMQSHDVVCAVADLDGELVGMAWLVAYERVPNPDDSRRLSGDLQSVFVVPERRNQGIGELLVRFACSLADERGIGKLTVDANERAAPFYLRLGFRRSGVLLQRPRSG